MAKLILLVVAAIWAAVLIPPLLRSRLENRPNSSVVDFRRQLAKLQNTSTPHRSMRAMGRPLTAVPRQRAQISSISSRDVSRGDMLVRRAPSEPMRHGGPNDRRHHGRFERSHVSGRAAPQTQRDATRPGLRHDPREHAPEVHEHDDVAAQRNTNGQRRQHGTTPRNGHRRGHQPAARTHGFDPGAHSGAGRNAVQRRRSNVTAALFALTAATLFLYTTTKSDVMMYGFAVSFLAFCGYVYLLAQQRQREATPWQSDRWLQH